MSNQIVAELPDEIAVIGLTGRFPGARNVEEFWQNLRNGVESISQFSEQELIEAGITPELVRRKDYVKARAILDDVELFDASFFNFTPREAEITDPQQRIFLECCWEALELAGYDPEDYSGLVGVFAGTSLSRYLLNLYSHPDLVESVGGFLISLGNDKDYLATRVSYKLNLRGPSVTVQTACSTSLVAVHLACQGLLNGECDIALAGGVTVSIPQKNGYLYREGGINSPNGQCRAFDANAQGTVSGSGVGVVVLKRLADAIADGDYIHAIIKGSAVNNDGSQKVGFTAPGVQGQASVIADALRMAGSNPESITYVEAHGTGTALGDPIEIAALTEAFRANAKKFCAIGSVKSNVGHLDTAAGVTGLIKTVLALKHRELPPSLHFSEPNPKIDFDNSPFFVNSRLREWTAGPTARRAGVSSFGIGGTNAHVVLEEAPPLESDAARRPFQLLLLSAKTDTALETATANTATYLREHPNVNLADVAFTLQVGRRSFSYRRAVLCGNVDDAVSALETLDSRRVHSGVQAHTNMPVVFMFSGQGAQYVNMGADLYREEAAFREQVDLCAELLKPELRLDLRELLYPISGKASEEASARLSQTFITQPALFVIEYSLAKLWMSWGVNPEAMIGHSIGEYVAACLAGVFSLEDALTIVAARGRMMQELPGGVMLTVSMPEGELQLLLGDGVSLAAVNGPSRFVLSGPADQMEKLEQRLAESGATYRQLRTSHAFHSAMMEPIGKPFAALLSKVKLGPPKIRFISNVTGTWITAAETTEPHYWVKHLRQTVRFADGLKQLFEEPKRILLEVGPGQTLATLAKQHPKKSVEQTILTCLRSASEQVSDNERLADTLGRLWLAGASIKWRNVNAGQKRLRLPLPTYPFEKKRYWVEHAHRSMIETTAAGVSEEPLVALNQKTEVPMFEVQAAGPAAASRQKQIVTGLIEIIFQLTGTKVDRIDPDVSFLEVGVDSLMMIQALRAIDERFGVEITLVQLVEELSTFGALIEHLNRLAPADRFVADEPETPQPEPVIAPSTTALTIPAGGGNGGTDGNNLYPFLERIITQQLDVISQLARALSGTNGTSARAIPNAAVVPGEPVASTSTRVVQNVAVVPTQPVRTSSPHLEQEAWSPFQQISEVKGDLDEHQQKHVADLIERYTRRTAKSKELTQTYRPSLADNRASAGFRLRWKELVYPIVGERSQGAFLWDVDGNKYVDLTMGFGVHLFGHSPSFIVKALHEQIEQGFQLGPQSLLAGRVAELICELTGMHRVTFCNSGTEAVMTAMRLARTVARRNKIALFAGSYHGSFDGTLARPLSAQSRAVPVATGIPQEMVENLLVLEYGSPESLEIVRAHAHELAAVLVEPVQSRRPSLQPRDYLHELRRITNESGTLLIFDEVITGFRVCPGGAQAWFGVEADLVTYGKVIGGGMPVGIIAGRSSCMDAIDGGMWRYGDDSYPRAEKTFFAGTFCKHPLAMACALAVLSHLRESGATLQERLNAGATQLAGALNEYFEAGQVPIRIEHFGSLMRFSIARQFKVDDLFFYHMVEKGVYVWEGRTCFLSTAHSADDIDFVIRAAKESVEAIREGGFLPKVTHTSSNGHGYAPAKETVDETVCVPMTEGQRQLWLLAQMSEEASIAYNESITLKLSGELHVGALHKSLQKIVERHESLRATVTAEGDQLRIRAAEEIEIPLQDLSHLDQSESERQASDWVTSEARRPFDLVAGPLLRINLIKLAAESHWLVLSMHHIIMDGWSTGIVLRELKAFYEAECTGAEAKLPKPVSFADYARRKVNESSEVQAAAESYWLERLADGVPVLELPSDRPRPPVQSFSGEHARATISNALYKRLKELSAREGSTLLVTTLAGFCLLLHRLSGQDDLIVAVPIADQSSLPEQAMIGYGLSVIPVRSRCDAKTSFADYMRGLRKAVLEGYEHRNYSLMSMTEKLKLRRDASRNPLFSVIFNLDHSRAKPRFHGLDIEIVSNHTGTSKFDLSLNVTETADDIQLDLKYSTDLFERKTIERWLRHFEQLLEAAVSDPSRPVVQLPMLTDQERRRLLIDWNDTARAYSRDTCLHELFEAQEARMPDSIAVMSDEETVSYCELNRRANQLAHQLRTLGVGPDVRVAIMLERSVEMIVALLGILKAGGSYVPLDPDYPQERLRFMLEDCGALLLLTNQRLIAGWDDCAVRVVCLDTHGEEISRQSDQNLASGVTSENLAYVIYTSGSTGWPKGVMLSHRGLINSIEWMQATYKLNSRDRFLCKTSLSFDPSVWEVFWPLAVGASVFVARHSGQQDAAYLADAVVRHGVTITYFVPSMFAVFVEEPRLAEASSLVSVICGGESLAAGPVRSFYSKIPGAELHHSYGVTEASIGTAELVCPHETEWQVMPIGRPRGNYQLYILDKQMEAVPVSVTGELYISGEGLARGYHNSADLTAEKFIPNPFSVEGGARLYRTGDLARYLSDGKVEFRGRADWQVKLRGMRIELGEIEAALREHAGVRDCAAMLRGHGMDATLIAYFVPTGTNGSGPSLSELREYLSRRLPLYMVPSAFIELEGLPLLPNGKVDRRSLASMSSEHLASSAVFAAARTPVEEVVADVWAEVLGMERVGVHDNFFELGGHSLLAMQVISRLREALGAEVGLRALFEAPTVEGVSAEVERVLAEGREPAPPIVRVARDSELPLSFAQQRLWFLQQLEPESYLYNVPTALHLTGELDVEALSRSLNEVLRRHEVLRTSFPAVGGQPRQLIAAPEPQPLVVQDLRALPDEEREAEVTRLLAKNARQPFDLSRGPVLRVQLLRVGEAEYVLQLTMHHIVSDAWSMGVLLNEAATLYRAYAQGEESPLAELPIQYADYAVWQREWLGGEVLEEQLAYWRKQLAGAPPALELPTDQPRPPIQSYRGASLTLNFSPELSAGVQELARHQGATLYMTLLAAFKLLLSRYAGQEDIVVGTPIAGRGHAELEGLIGFFVNTLVLRTDVSGDLTFSELLGRVRHTCLEAYVHQDIPFERLVEELQPHRDMSRSPLFQVMFALQNAIADGAVELPGLQLRPFEYHEEIAKFDLMFTAFDHGGGRLGVSVQYNTDLFERETAARWLRHFEQLLEGAVSTPSAQVAQLRMLTDEERHRQLFEWNQTETDYTKAPDCLHELFEVQAARTPNNVALVFEDEELTYAESNLRAEARAHYLRGLGVGPEVVVAVMAERSIELVVGLLGVLKAGGAYLPVDPEYPRERIAFMLSNSRVSVLLTQKKFVERVPEGIKHVLMLDEESWETAAVSENVETAPGPLNLAYVIYTSGSTGVPKGVMNTHGGIVNRLLWMQDAYCLTPHDVVLQKTPYTFDVSVWEFFWPLLAGAQLVLARPGGHREAEYLADLIARRHVTVMHFVPSMLHVFLQQPKLERCKDLKRVICSGEALAFDLQERFFEQLPSVALHNLYGPTEAAIDVSYWRCEHGNPRASVPIGYPISNIQLYVLDERLEPAPVGVAGEVYIGGAGLARGYLNMPELTAEKFIPSPFGPQSGARLYRTGDVGRHLANASIEFLGRVDDQVKVRGLRIELGEIEALLRSYAPVADCTVIAHRRGPTGDRLVAYVVAHEPGATLSTAELRRHLRRHLPEYMVPSTFVSLERLPLTASGKVDRRALPEPGPATTDSDYVAPRTAIEEVVVGIWSEVLHVERVGVRDNFFELGGHSLLATQVVSRLREALGAEVGLRVLFEFPTVEGVSAEVERVLSEGREPAPPIVRVVRDGELPLSFAQQRLWFLQQLEPESYLYNVPIALHLMGALKVSALGRSFNEIIRRHEVLRTSFPAAGGQPWQLISPPEQQPLVVKDLRALPAAEQKAEVKRLLEQSARQPFDLERGPVLRLQLLRLGELDHVLQLTMHHIVSDGWSMAVLVQEFGALYAAFARDETSPLPELPIQYADFAVWQRDWLTGDVLESQLQYWREQLAEAPALLELPSDRPRSAVQTNRGAVIEGRLPDELSGQLRDLGRREGATLFMVLLAAFQVLLSRYTGQHDIVVGTPIAGRTRPELENLIGFFVNALVLRTRVSEDQTFLELLRQVRETALNAYANQEVPFEKLVEEIQPERNLRHTPLFQVVFSMQNAPWRPLTLPGITLATLPTENETSKFDLVLNMWDSGNNIATSLHYNTDLFDETTVTRLLGHLETLLHGIATTPSQRLSEISLLKHEERERLLFESNRTDADYPAHDCIHHLFEAQVERTPEAVALVFGDQRLSYSELNRRANQIAQHLRSIGIERGAAVGVYLEHSIEMVAGLLGVLKAGAAYVPLEPSHPAARTNFVISDAGISVVLTHPNQADGLTVNGLTVVPLESDFETVSRWNDENPARLGTAGDLAYIIYTSGSTGVPKGVMIEHAALINYIWWAKDVYLGSESLDFPLYSSLAFDLTVTSIFTPLLQGGKVLIYDKAGSDFPIIRILDEDEVDVLKLTPSHFALMEGRDNSHSRIKRLIVGGEAFETTLARRIRESFGAHVEIINEYGPTEATVGCMIHRFDAARDERAAVPIGVPAANVQIYVLDRSLRPVAENVVGELYVGGAGLARGYLGRPKLTAERFLPNPFSEAGSRLYRTGDLARRLGSGAVEFLGRSDEQVKFHGYRVELGELRAALNRYPGVRDSVVVVRQDAAGRALLVAYYVARQEVPVGELRQFMLGEVVSEVVPQVFIHLRRLPLTLNGKVNLEALPVPKLGGMELTSEFVGPRSPVEELVAGVWAEVLGVERIGVRDNFFELGGHSLLATQVVSRLREALGAEVGLRVLFESPTVEGVSAEVERVLAEGREPAPPIVRVARNGELPLSFAQQRLWFLQQLEPDNTAYNIPLALRLKGALNVNALQESFNELVRRHEVLRTVFRKIDGEPVQVIEAAVDVSLPVTELQHLPEGERAKEIERAVLEAASERFDLELGPLHRAQLLRISEDEHVLLCTMHHIVSDGWSIGVMLREAAALYQAFSKNQTSTLPELPVQYADYAVWQRNWLQGEVLDQQLSYWRRQLAGAPPAIDLPTDRPRPPVQSFCGSSVELSFSDDLTAQLKGLSRRENATLYMTLLAAFKVLLARITRQDSVVVGTPVAGRGRMETDGLIGFFVNMLVLRTDVSSNLNFRELLARVRSVTVEAYANQDVPFEKLVDELQPQRDLSRSPLFQVMFSFGTEERESGGFDELAVTVLNSENRTAKFDLTLAVTDAGDRVSGNIQYNSDLFDETTIVRLATHYRSLLESIAGNPEQPVSSLSLLTNEERRTLLSDWNQTAVDYPLNESVPEMFERQVTSTPDATAVTCGDICLSYAELNRRANQLGHHLQALGVGFESRVGIMVQRSADMVVGLLAILKAGGAYVPLDPAFPRERLRFMMDDAKISVLLTLRELVDDLGPGDATVVLLDADWDKIEKESSGNLGKTADADNLAYLIYTSGSTGKPKGVQISHRALTNFLLSMQHRPGLTSEDILLSVTTLSFDIAGLELYLPLVSGACVAIVSRAVASDGIRLKESLETMSATVMQATPATWQMLVDAGWQGSKYLKVLCGGEALSRQLANVLLARSAALWNMYGPTETTIWSAACKLESDDGVVTIGRPIANTQLYVLDETQQPVPIGVPGELYIGGAGLARGYQNRPELTAETFVPDSFGSAPGGRLYRTGDLVRYLPEGNLIYLGRADRQMKIRGFRVEPSEVEAVLRQHDSVRDVAVVAPGTDLSERRIIAYVVLQEGKSAPETVEFREFLKQRIPEYMLPDTYVTINELPLTANGKVDYRKLESTNVPALRPRTEFVAPRNTLELQLAQIWEDILKISRVGVMDKFFEIGGNSLLAVRLMSRIEKQFGKELPLATLFQASTVEQLASVLSQEVGPATWRPLVAIQPRGTRPPFFCVHPIGGTVLLYYHLARYLGEDQPFYAMQAPGLLAEDDCQTSIEDMAALYNRELREVQPSGPYRLGGYSFGGIVAFEMAQQLLRDGERVALVALFDGGAPKNVEKMTGEVEDALILAELLKERARMAGQEFQLPHEEILGTAPEERLSHVINLAKSAGVVPMEVELDWVKRFLRGFKLRAGAASRYMPSIYPGRLTFFRSTERDQDTIKTMQQAGVDLNDHTFGWNEFSAEPIEVIFVPGYHETLMLEPNVQTLAERLRSCLDRSESTNLNGKGDPYEPRRNGRQHHLQSRA